MYSLHLESSNNFHGFQVFFLNIKEFAGGVQYKAWKSWVQDREWMAMT